MNTKNLSLSLLAIGLLSCNSTTKKKTTQNTKIYPDIKIVGAMKNVMWKGQLNSNINLDTIRNKNGLYGLGPVSYLAGELLINNGKSYVSKVVSDTTMIVENTFKTSAPFFVYGNVTEWQEIELPAEIKTIQNLEEFINNKTTAFKRPFVFKLKGQVNYNIANENVQIIGFFSTEHKGVFTHHDSFLHMHLITEDQSKMGHLDKLEIETMKLYLPIQ